MDVTIHFFAGKCQGHFLLILPDPCFASVSWTWPQILAPSFRNVFQLQFNHNARATIIVWTSTVERPCSALKTQRGSFRHDRFIYGDG
ncbi:MAG TPA: hypothetical protein PLC60_09360 [Saprospiraceae bacterium]|nr:hypothetical protein [Saprospiraceae bacterium]